jgi:hypothetical protein
MAVKPLAALAHATDANYSSGPANGFPTKVVIPSTGQGFVPGDDIIPEYLNFILNQLDSWTDWMFDGSSAGAADAHVLETDANGDTACRTLQVEGRLNALASDAGVLVGVGPNDADRYLRRMGRIHSKAYHRRVEFRGGTGASDVEDFSFAVTGGGPGIATSGHVGGGMRFRTASSANETSRMFNGPRLGNEFGAVIQEFFFQITSVLTNLEIEMGHTNVVGFPPSGNGVDGVSFKFFSGSDTFYTLVACDGSTVATAAGTTAPVVDDYVRVTLVSESDGSCEMYVNGIREASLPAASYGPLINTNSNWVNIETLDATEKAFNMTRFDVWMDEPQAIGPP